MYTPFAISGSPSHLLQYLAKLTWLYIILGLLGVVLLGALVSSHFFLLYSLLFCALIFLYIYEHFRGSHPKV